MFKVALALILVMTLASSASAQTGMHVSVGPGIDFHKYTDDRFKSKSPGLAILYRLSLHPEKVKDGWKFEPAGSVGLSRLNTDAELAGETRRLGRLRMIPVTVGGGPGYRRGPTKVGFSADAGVSFNKFTVDGGTRTTLAGLGQDLTSVDVNNAFTAHTGVSVWHDLSSRLGVHAGASYVFHHPTAKTTIDGVTTTEKWKTDKVKFVTGFAVGLF